MTNQFYENNVFIEAPAMEFLEHFEDESIDCIITDPAYWTLDEHRSVGTTTRLGGHHDPEKRNGWFQTIDNQELWELMNLMYVKLRMNSHLYLMCDGKTLRWVLGYADEWTGGTGSRSYGTR